jgi:hypothetical protein
MSEKIKINNKIVKVAVIKGDSSHRPPSKEEIVKENVRLPDDTPARVKVLRAEGKKWYLTVTYHEENNQPFALFCKTNHIEKTAQTSDAIGRLLKLAKAKGIPKKFIDSTRKKSENDPNIGKLTRVISLLLRHGVLVKNIVSELNKMEDIYVGSFLFQLKKFLCNYIHDGEVADGHTCNECGGDLVYQEGCFKCISCGNSKCG